MGSDELHRLFGIAFRDRRLSGWPLDDLLIAHERHIPVGDLGIPEGRAAFGSVGNAIHVVGIGDAKIAVESVVGWKELRQVTQMPLANTGGGIAFGLECLGQRYLLGRNSACGIREQNSPFIAAHPVADGQPPRQQSGPTGCADGTRGIELSESHPLGRHTIQIGGPDRWMPKAAQVAVAQIVRIDHDDVRCAACRDGLQSVASGPKERRPEG